MSLIKNSIVFISLFFATCTSEPKIGWNKHLHSDDVLNSQKVITADILNDYITSLSSDEYEGRKPATAGGKKTISYQPIDPSKDKYYGNIFGLTIPCYNSDDLKKEIGRLLENGGQKTVCSIQSNNAAKNFIEHIYRM